MYDGKRGIAAKIEKLGDLTWDEDCDHCMSNPFTLDAIETKKHLEKDKELATKYLDKKSRMDDKIQKMFKVRAYKQDLDKLGQSLVEGKTAAAFTREQRFTRKVEHSKSETF